MQQNFKQAILPVFLHKNLTFSQNSNMDKNLESSYSNLYNSDLKHIEKNLNNFIRSKRENAKRTNTYKKDA